MDKITLVSDKDSHFGICLKFIRFQLNIYHSEDLKDERNFRNSMKINRNLFDSTPTLSILS